MKYLGVTQSDVAEAFDMTPAGVQKWLSGAREPSLDDLIKLADMLKMPRAQLLLGTEPGDDIGDLPPYARDPLRRLARGARVGMLSKEWFARFEHALEAISPSAEVSTTKRLDYRSAAIGLATALDLKRAEIPYMAFIRQVDTIVSEQELPAPAAPASEASRSLEA